MLARAISTASRGVAGASVATARSMAPRALVASAPSSGVQARPAATSSKRPLSPHLTIYAPGINMVTSVWHRGTGMFMWGGTCPAPAAALRARTPRLIVLARASALSSSSRSLARSLGSPARSTARSPTPPPLCFTPSRAALTTVSVGLAVSSHPVEHYIEMAQASSFLKPLFKFGVAFPVVYHMGGGMRHLLWDSVRGQAVDEVNKSAYALLGVSIPLALLLTFTEFDG